MTEIPSDNRTSFNLQVHPWRSYLYEELHSRPSPVIDGACQVTHFTVLLDDKSESMLAHVTDLCKRFSVPVPASDSSCLYQTFGGFELRWERHLEFSNFTFICPNVTPFSTDALAYVPKDWLASIPGELVIACHVAVLNEQPTEQQLQHWFENQVISGSQVVDGKAQVWTAFKLHSDGFGRLVTSINDLTPYQSGRMIQRLLEVETYRLMSLLALPMARKTGGELRPIDESLASLIQRVSQMDSDSDERLLLQELSGLAAEVERHRSQTNYRFSAAVAYHDLVRDRLKQLKEMPIDGMQSLREFLERRLTPGIKTCNSVRDRLEDLSRRINRTTSLLRTRVDLSIQEQNQHLLSSMNRRGQMQLRLQQTVEGFSVVAISYYLVSLLGIAFDSMQTHGLVPSANLLKGIAVPVVLGVVYWGVHRMRARITRNRRHTDALGEE